MLMLWSQIIYGHRTASISPKYRTILRRPAGGRKNRTIFYRFLDIVRCPVKLGTTYNSTAPVRRLVGSLRVKSLRPGTVRCLDGARPAFLHIGRAPDDFYLIFISYDSNGAHPGTVRCPAGHRTMSDKRQEISKIA